MYRSLCYRPVLILTRAVVVHRPLRTDNRDAIIEIHILFEKLVYVSAPRAWKCMYEKTVFTGMASIRKVKFPCA
jgi:hypothetical protein